MRNNLWHTHTRTDFFMSVKPWNVGQNIRLFDLTETLNDQLVDCLTSRWMKKIQHLLGMLHCKKPASDRLVFSDWMNGFHWWVYRFYSHFFWVNIIKGCFWIGVVINWPSKYPMNYFNQNKKQSPFNRTLGFFFQVVCSLVYSSWIIVITNKSTLLFITKINPNEINEHFQTHKPSKNGHWFIPFFSPKEFCPGKLWPHNIHWNLKQMEMNFWFWKIYGICN